MAGPGGVKHAIGEGDSQKRPERAGLGRERAHGARQHALEPHLLRHDPGGEPARRRTAAFAQPHVERIARRRALRKQAMGKQAMGGGVVERGAKRDGQGERAGDDEHAIHGGPTHGHAMTARLASLRP